MTTVADYLDSIEASVRNALRCLESAQILPEVRRDMTIAFGELAAVKRLLGLEDNSDARND